MFLPLPLVLASSSPYRRELLARLGLPFEWAAPEVDETPLFHETASDTAERLAVLKAKALDERYPAALLIGSDQVALLEGQKLGKPGTHERAIEQLRQMRGKTVIFHTALCLYNSQTGTEQLSCVDYEVGFRKYSDEEIERYLQKERPYNCAGSAKSEGLGITLMTHMRGDDPNALVGLPLIRLAEMLRAEGVEIV